MRDHGGNLDAARARFGGGEADWLDLSTGINPLPYPLPDIPAEAWARLPTRSAMAALAASAAQVYRTAAEVVPLAGAQGAIQMVPYLQAPGKAAIITPTYNEHAGALRQAGWVVKDCDALADLEGADLAIVVNPNNPDGNSYDPQSLLELSRNVGLLVVDESFGDAQPALSVAPLLTPGTERIVVQRSFGKFYGLAGVRLGFALAGSQIAEQLRAMAGPWPVSGPAIAIAEAALKDTDWHAKTCARLDRDAARLDAMCQQAGWALVGGTPLFRTYAVPEAVAAQEVLARGQVWSRIFPYSATWVRLGLPGCEAEWQQLARALG